jgi:hypothetical protein
MTLNPTDLINNLSIQKEMQDSLLSYVRSRKNPTDLKMTEIYDNIEKSIPDITYMLLSYRVSSLSINDPLNLSSLKNNIKMIIQLDVDDLANVKAYIKTICPRASDDLVCDVFGWKLGQTIKGVRVLPQDIQTKISEFSSKNNPRYSCHGNPPTPMPTVDSSVTTLAPSAVSLGARCPPRKNMRSSLPPSPPPKKAWTMKVVMEHCWFHDHINTLLTNNLYSDERYEEDLEEIVKKPLNSLRLSMQDDAVLQETVVIVELIRHPNMWLKESHEFRTKNSDFDPLPSTNAAKQLQPSSLQSCASIMYIVYPRDTNDHESEDDLTPNIENKVYEILNRFSEENDFLIRVIL